MQAERHVLVFGATGVTGSLAVQMAKAVFGAGRVSCSHPQRCSA